MAQPIDKPKADENTPQESGDKVALALSKGIDSGAFQKQADLFREYMSKKPGKEALLAIVKDEKQHAYKRALALEAIAGMASVANDVQETALSFLKQEEDVCLSTTAARVLIQVSPPSKKTAVRFLQTKLASYDPEKLRPTRRLLIDVGQDEPKEQKPDEERGADLAVGSLAFAGQDAVIAYPVLTRIFLECPKRAPIRPEAAVALAQCDKGSEFLLEQLQGGEDSFVMEAVMGFGWQHPSAISDNPVLRAKVHAQLEQIYDTSKNRREKERAAWALARLGVRWPEMMQFYLAKEKPEEPIRSSDELRRHAQYDRLLDPITEDGTDILSQSLQHKDHGVRFYAVNELQRRASNGDKKALQATMRYIQDATNGPFTRLAIAQSLKDRSPDILTKEDLKIVEGIILELEK